MRALKIDVTTQSITEITLKDNILESMQNVVGGLITTASYLENNDCILVDDEGLMKPIFGAFEIENCYQPFIGNAVIVGTDNDGNTIDAKSDIDNVKKIVTFLTGEELMYKYK